ncbi:MAG: hypothetical protein WCO53_14780 [Deltaproteobacteria bacterium]
MPSNRQYRTRKIKQSITPALRFYFETGTYDGPFPAEDLCDTFILSNREDDLKAAWEANKQEIMAEWTKNHPPPGDMPFAWWRFDSQKMT